MNVESKLGSGRYHVASELHLKRRSDGQASCQLLVHRPLTRAVQRGTASQWGGTWKINKPTLLIWLVVHSAYAWMVKYKAQAFPGSKMCVGFSYAFAGAETSTLLDELVVTDVAGVSPSPCKLVYLTEFHTSFQKTAVLKSIVLHPQKKLQRRRWWKQEEQRLGKLWLRRVEASSAQMIGNAKRKCLL